MSKIDVLIMSIIAVIMAGFFWLDTRWSFFGAGVCITIIFFISMGFLFRNLEYGHRNKEWNQFLNSLDKSETLPEVTTTDANA